MPFRPTRTPSPARLAARFLPELALLAALAWPAPALATFHLNAVSKVMVGYDGDANVQAVEFQMLANGENLLNGAAVKVYDGAGNLIATVGTFGADLPAANALTGNKFLCATMKFKQKFGITPDLQISAGLLPTSGQITLEKVGCVIDAVAYGAVSAFLVGTAAAPPLPTTAAAVLVRTFNPASLPSCPLDDDSALHFGLRSATAVNPVIFANNSGVTASVASTLTAVETTVPAASRFRIAPNPVRSSALIEAPPARRVTIFDVRGRLVREVAAPSGAASPMRVRWAGDDRLGRPVPSGIYFLRYEGDDGVRIRRFAVVR